MSLFYYVLLPWEPLRSQYLRKITLVPHTNGFCQSFLKVDTANSCIDLLTFCIQKNVSIIINGFSLLLYLYTYFFMSLLMVFIIIRYLLFNVVGWKKYILYLHHLLGTSSPREVLGPKAPYFGTILS